MIDLETFGTRPGCVVAALGAVVFTEDGPDTGKTFYRRIDLQSCVDRGLELDADTVLWWMRKSNAARAEITRAADCGLPVALCKFAEWLHWVGGGGGLEVWGNGADFDNPILEAAFDACRLPAPWGPKEGRCYRTLKNLFPAIASPVCPPEEVHNALNDAVRQATHAGVLLRVVAEIEKHQMSKPSALPKLPACIAGEFYHPPAGSVGGV